MSISKTSKCLISLNLLEKKKGAKWNNFQRNLKRNFKEILVLKILRLLIALKHSFKGFKGKKALFNPFDIFLMHCVKLVFLGRILFANPRTKALAFNCAWRLEPAIPRCPHLFAD